MSQGEALLSVSNLCKSYGSHRVLHDAAFELHSGEVLCLVGENGAGKSTLIKILSGAVEPDSGTITIQSRTFNNLRPRESMELGISTIYQDVELIESLSVSDNIFLGNERVARLPFVVDAKTQRLKAREILDMLHIDIDEKRLVEDLSAAQKQTLQIVKALHQDARVLIMDEPTSSLGVEETRSLMRLVGELRARGIGIIYVSHYLEEVFDIGDTIMVLKDGEQVGIYVRSEVDADFVIRKMVGRDASMFFAREQVDIGEVRLQVRDITWNGVVDHVSFDVRRGEVFGIGGMVGSGRSELVSLVFGMGQKDGGDIVLDGKVLNIRRPADAIHNGICLITEDRKKLAMFGDRSVIENITIVHNELAASPLLNLAAERRISNEMVETLHISVADLEQSLGSLSGGNQQKAIIARWLLNDATLFIFDEPTKGVDIGAKREIYELIVGFARQGKSIIMVSSDMPELLSMSDRIGIMRGGSMTTILNNQNVDEEELIRHFVGMQVE